MSKKLEFDYNYAEVMKILKEKQLSNQCCQQKQQQANIKKPKIYMNPGSFSMSCTAPENVKVIYQHSCHHCGELIDSQNEIEYFIGCGKGISDAEILFYFHRSCFIEIAGEEYME